MTPDTEYPFHGSPAPPVDPAALELAQQAEQILLGAPVPNPTVEPAAVSLAKQKLSALRETLKALEATEPARVVVTLPELLNLLEVLRTQRGNHYVASLKERLQLEIILPYAELCTIQAVMSAYHQPFPAPTMSPAVAKLAAQISELESTIAHAQGQPTDKEIMAAAVEHVAKTYVPPVPMTKPPIGPAFAHLSEAQALNDMSPSSPGVKPTHAEHKFNPFTGKEK